MNGSILSFENRGPWGDAKWRGNCSGYVYLELLKSLKPKLFVDPMMGSGTSIEVARELGIEAVGLDLHQGFDALTMSILQRVGRPADCVLSHPPYGAMIRYSGQVWGTEAHPNDLSWAVDDEDFHEKLQRVLLNQRDATAPGGVYGALIGDYRRNGVYTSYQAEMIARMPKSELAAVIIKAQHNCMSGRKTYGKMRFGLLTHEYFVLWEKPKTIQSAVQTLTEMAKAHARRLQGTWKSIVLHALTALGGKASLQSIYSAMQEHAPERLKESQHWKAKVRQVVQMHPEFKPAGDGVWSLA